MRSGRLVSAGPAIGRRFLTRAGAGCALLAALATLMLADDAAAVSVVDERAPSISAPHCSLKGSTTIAANRHVRVFRAKTPLGEVYGCRRSANRAYELGVSTECQNYDDIADVVIAGNLAALNVFTCSLHASQTRVVLISLRTGRVMFVAAPLSTAAPSEGHLDGIHGMVLTSGGRLAWLGVRTLRDVVVAAEVRRRARASSKGAVLLDSGVDIDPGSLRRSGTRAFWLKGASKRSAGL